MKVKKKEKENALLDRPVMILNGFFGCIELNWLGERDVVTGEHRRMELCKVI